MDAKLPFKPVIQPNHITVQRNIFARDPQISWVLQRCYTSDILPPRDQHPTRFQHSEIYADLYISERSWCDEIDFAWPSEAGRHEAYLDSLFWDPASTRKELCILGAVGSGKSTLLDYFFRCHCPNESKFKHDFDKTLVIYFNANVIQDNADFYHEFFLSGQSSIRFQCEAKSFDIDGAVRRRATHPNNVREWVWAALEELSQATRAQ
jgi:hypothetical protein